MIHLFICRYIIWQPKYERLKSFESDVYVRNHSDHEIARMGRHATDYKIVVRL